MPKPHSCWTVESRAPIDGDLEVRFERSTNGGVRYRASGREYPATTLTSVSSIVDALWPRPTGEGQALAERLVQAGILTAASINPYLSATAVNAQARGLGAHAWLAKCLSTGWVSPDVPQDCRKHVLAALCFVADAGLQIRPGDCEVMVAHPELRIAGRVDAIACSREGDVLIEFKTVLQGQPELPVRAMMAAFAQLELLRTSAARSGRHPAHCIAVILGGNGAYTCVEKPDVPSSFAEAAVAGYRAATTLLTHVRSARVTNALKQNLRSLDEPRCSSLQTRPCPETLESSGEYGD